MQELHKISISIQTSIRDALKLFGATDGLRILIVADQRQNFQGILTEQDIRRGILNGISIDQSVETIVNTSPITATVNTSRQQLLALAAKHNIYEIPILDKGGRLVKIESIAKILQIPIHQNPVVIMAGGLGTRLKPLTDNLPKPMLKVGKKPILQIIVERFRNQGFSNFYFCVNYKSHIIEEYFGNGEKLGVKISYIHEERRMGTAGALGLIENIGVQDFFVMNGDILTEIDFGQMLDWHQSQDADATMGIREFNYQVPYGVIRTSNSGSIVSIEEKPNIDFNVSAGVYILNPKTLELIPRGELFDMPQLFEKMLKEKGYNTQSFLITDYWIDIGRHEEYSRAKEEVRD